MSNAEDLLSMESDRRQFLQRAAALGVGVGVGGLPAVATAGERAAPKPPPVSVAVLVHPGMILQDLVGPLTMLAITGSKIDLVAATREPVSTDLGIPLIPTATFTTPPKKADVLLVPGGLAGTIGAMDDPATRAWVGRAGADAKWVTGVCTGVLVLAAAGLLKGYRATAHWYVRDHLSLMGATPVNRRVVRDRNRLTGAGVTSGLDFGLRLVSLLRGRTEAQRVQLLMEYAPEPPFNAGTPRTAPRGVTRAILEARGPLIEQARVSAERAGASLR